MCGFVMKAKNVFLKTHPIAWKIAKLRKEVHSVTHVKISVS